jgi:hypothetical protein
LRSAAPARNVETASTPTVNVLRGLVARATTPLLPDDYFKRRRDNLSRRVTHRHVSSYVDRDDPSG